MLAINALEISSFFPEDSFIVTDIENNDNEILIKLKSRASSCECPRCHTISNHYHGTYIKESPGSSYTWEGCFIGDYIS